VARKTIGSKSQFSGRPLAGRTEESPVTLRVGPAVATTGSPRPDRYDRIAIQRQETGLPWPAWRQLSRSPVLPAGADPKGPPVSTPPASRASTRTDTAGTVKAIKTIEAVDGVSTSRRPHDLPSVAIARLNAISLPALRMALGAVYLWFGGLKVAGVSPVADLVEGTVRFLGPPPWFVPALGLVEVGIGAWLLVGRRLRPLLPIFAGHMVGTFAVLVTQPAMAFQDGNPLELTSTGEFVVKNLVLLAAGAAVLTAGAARR
jgi:putative oxidoreductase